MSGIYPGIHVALCEGQTLACVLCEIIRFKSHLPPPPPKAPTTKMRERRAKGVQQVSQKFCFIIFGGQGIKQSPIRSASPPAEKGS